MLKTQSFSGKKIVNTNFDLVTLDNLYTDKKGDPWSFSPQVLPMLSI